MRDATGEDVARQGESYAMNSRPNLVGKLWCDLITKKVGPERTVGDVLDEKALTRLRKQASARADKMLGLEG